MEETEILKRLEEQEKKLDEIYSSIERMRKYFLWTLIITIVVIIFPLVGLVFVIPQFLGTYTGGF